MIETKTDQTIDGQSITVVTAVRRDLVKITVTSAELYQCKDKTSLEDLVAMRLSARGVPMRVVNGEWRPEFGVLEAERSVFDEFGDHRVTWTP